MQVLSYTFHNFTVVAFNCSHINSGSSVQDDLRILQFYRTSRLMNKLYIHTNGRFFLPILKLTIGVVTIFSTSAAIKLSGRADGVILTGLYAIAMTYTIPLFALISLSATIYRLTKKITTKLKHGPLNTNSTNQKDLRTLSPFGIRIGLFFVIEEATPLLFFEVLCNCMYNHRTRWFELMTYIA